MTALFQREGQDFIALNRGPMFQFSPAISFYVSCATQTEVDTLWERLSAGGETQRCGWLRDRFGVSSQINPTVLGLRSSDPDPVTAPRVMQAMLQMTKLDSAALQAAHAQPKHGGRRRASSHGAGHREAGDRESQPVSREGSVPTINTRDDIRTY